MRRLGVVVGLLVLVAAVAGGGAAVWARAQQHARVHSTAVSIHPQGDTNFCLESEGDGTLIVSQCAVRDNQHFTFTDDSDGTNLLVDGFGECLDLGNGRDGRLVAARQCSFGSSQEFVFTRTDKLANAAGTVCVAVSAPTQNAQVFDFGCHRSAGDAQELFALTH